MAAEAVDIKSKADNFFVICAKIIKTFYVSKKLYDIYILSNDISFMWHPSQSKKSVLAHRGGIETNTMKLDDNTNVFIT